MDYVAEAAEPVIEVVPWELDEELGESTAPLVLDIREPYDFDCMHIDFSYNVHEETIPELIKSRERKIVEVCRSGHRSLLAANILIEIGYASVRSLKTGLRGWNDYEMPLVRREGEEPVRENNADKYFTPNVRKDQLKPKSWSMIIPFAQHYT